MRHVHARNAGVPLFSGASDSIMPIMVRQVDSRQVPWSSYYDEGLPVDIRPEYPSALAMFRAGIETAGASDFIRYFDSGITGNTIDQLSDGLASGLSALGLSNGDRVGLYMQNVPQFEIALVAIWKLAAIAVPCNPMLRARELAAQLRDSGAIGLIALEGLYTDVAAAVLAETDVRVVVTTSELDLLEGPRPAILAEAQRSRPSATHDLFELSSSHVGQPARFADPGPSDIALLTYTSGTTGPPKGAINTHENVVFSSQVYREWMHVTHEDVILGIAPLSHITGLIAYIGLAMAAPAPLVLAYRFEPGETLRLIERHRTSVTVAAITAYLALAANDDLGLRDTSSLQKTYSGGAPIAPAVADGIERRTGWVIRSAYGLTETTSPTHLTPLGKRSPVDPSSGALAVGVPVFNTRTRILSDQGEALGPMEVGEVAVSGPQVIPGYWRNPTETTGAIQAGELRTGDVGKIDPDGWLYIIDRKKDLIISSGYKIWPTEVENVLLEHLAVREAAVIGDQDSYRGESVHAFVSLEPGFDVSSAELICFCRERLAAYKCPRVVDVVSELPKTASGKIIRRQLLEAVVVPDLHDKND
jgi:long-chain acyl-CoA synthetase